MNLETLKLFCDVVRCRSFSRGAASNAVSQSAASQAINQLEAEVGVQLIDRTRRPFILTAEGEIYYKGACEILENYEYLLASLQAIRQEIRGVVRVSAIYSVGLHDMAQCVQGFMGQFPRAKVRLSYQRPAEIYESVLNDEADLGIVSYPSASRELGVIPLGDEEMVLCCRLDHHLAGRKDIPLRLLNGEDFVTFDRDLTIRKELDRCLREEQLAVRVVMEFDNIETIKQAIQIGAGVSILPEPTVRKEVRKGTLAAIRLAGNRLTRPIGIIHRQRKAFTPALSKFVEILQATKLGGSGMDKKATKPVPSVHESPE